MRLLELKKRPVGMDALQAASAVGQGDLFRAYEQRLAKHGTRAAQVLLTLSDISERAHYVNARQTLERLVNWNVVPVINENDTTSTDEITFGDNDFLAAHVAVLLGARLLILLTNTDGLFTADPRSDPDAQLVRDISELEELEDVEIGSGTSSFGRGGMESKVAAAKIASQSGIEVAICNGTSAGTLQEVVSGGQVGTRFAPHSRGRSAPYKLWLRHAKEPSGSLYVDEGAAERLRDGGASLLAVGVVDVAGSFRAGDAVTVLAERDSEVIGKGISEYSAPDLSAVMGLKSDAIRDRFPDAAGEVIHRDRFVLV
jgi:glutamate 5-kinase